MRRNVEEHLDFVVNCIRDIKYNSAIILTGPNGSGKSLVRKQMDAKLKSDNITGKVSQVSMQLRTSSGYLMGIGAFVSDPDWEPTSCHTHHLINQLLNSVLNDDHRENETKRYIIIDEPEIGMSRESQLAIALYIKSMIPELLEKTLGIMIITHSETIVQVLKESCDFRYLDIDKQHMTADEWLNREIKPTNFEEMAEWSHQLFLEVTKRSKEHQDWK